MLSSTNKKREIKIQTPKRVQHDMKSLYLSVWFANYLQIAGTLHAVVEDYKLLQDLQACTKARLNLRLLVYSTHPMKNMFSVYTR